MNPDPAAPGSLKPSMTFQGNPETHLASRNRERRIMTASHVLCLSCIWMELNLRWMMLTILSISFGEMGLVRLCSRRRFITWVVNSLHAYVATQGTWGELKFTAQQTESTTCSWGDFLETWTSEEKQEIWWHFIKSDSQNKWLSGNSFSYQWLLLQILALASTS